MKRPAIRVGGLPDFHVPWHDPAAFAAFILYVASQRWDYFVIFGDFLDFDEISRFVTPKAAEGRRIEGDAKLARALLRRLVAAARLKNSRAVIYFIEGNHEHRLARFVSQFPAFDGLFDLPSLLEFKTLGVRFIAAESKGELLRFEWIGHDVVSRTRTQASPLVELARPSIAFTHGWYHGRHHAQQHAQRYAWGPIYYGHLHETQAFVVERFGGGFEAASCGYMGRLPDAESGGLGYAANAPTKWAQGFAEFLIDRDRAWGYTRIQHRIQDGRMITPSGVVIDGNEGK